MSSEENLGIGLKHLRSFPHAPVIAKQGKGE
jgi:hypothetical protein